MNICWMIEARAKGSRKWVPRHPMPRFAAARRMAARFTEKDLLGVTYRARKWIAAEEGA